MGGFVRTRGFYDGSGCADPVLERTEVVTGQRAQEEGWSSVARWGAQIASIERGEV